MNIFFNLIAALIISVVIFILGSIYADKIEHD
jgi:hypothetical protein